jgi:hypothetical protein
VQGACGAAAFAAGEGWPALADFFSRMEGGAVYPLDQATLLVDQDQQRIARRRRARDRLQAGDQ